MRGIGVVATRDINRGFTTKLPTRMPSGSKASADGRRPPRRRVGRRRLRRRARAVDLRRGGVAAGCLRRPGLAAAAAAADAARRASSLLLVLADRAGGIETGLAGARGGRSPPRSARRGSARRSAAGLTDRSARAGTAMRRPLARAHPPATADKRRRQRREHEAGCVATARQRVSRCTMHRAGARAPSCRARTATAGARPRPGGRWLMGFKDLWLTGPLIGPGRPRNTGPVCEERPVQGIVNTIN